MYFRPKCTICRFPVHLPNRLVRYHIKYDPPLVILACSYCNYVEFSLRNHLDVKDPNRAVCVRRYMLKFGVKL